MRFCRIESLTLPERLSIPFVLWNIHYSFHHPSPPRRIIQLHSLGLFLDNSCVIMSRETNSRVETKLILHQPKSLLSYHRYLPPPPDRYLIIHRSPSLSYLHRDRHELKIGIHNTLLRLRWRPSSKFARSVGGPDPIGGSLSPMADPNGNSDNTNGCINMSMYI
jgi:hypothetical protein